MIFARIIFAIMITVNCAQAQMNSFFPGPGAPVGGVSYSGIGDIQTMNVYVGLRAYTSATRGNNLINLCEPTDTTCIDVASDVSTGTLVAPTNVGGTDCTAVNTCTIKTWYDQVGNFCTGSVACNFTQATAANRAVLIWSCENSRPCARFDGASDGYASTATMPSVSATTTVVAASSRTGNFTTSQFIFSTLGANSIQFNYRQVTNAVQMFAGTAGQFIGNISDSKSHVLQGVFNGASSSLICFSGGGVNDTNCSSSGNSNAINPGATASSGGIAAAIGFNNAGANFLTGDLKEVSFISGTANASTTVGANAYSYWGPF